MELMDYNNFEKKERAKKRVEELKGFYWHLIIYIAVNTFISVNKVIRNLDNGETFNEAFFDLGTFFIWGAWGIGLLYHALKVYGIRIFGKEWEERQIRKYMKEDEQQNGWN